MKHEPDALARELLGEDGFYRIRDRRRTTEQIHDLARAYLELHAQRDQAIGLLYAIVKAEQIDRLPGDHAISVVLSLSVDEFLASIGSEGGADAVS